MLQVDSWNLKYYKVVTTSGTTRYFYTEDDLLKFVEQHNASIRGVYRIETADISTHKG